MENFRNVQPVKVAKTNIVDLEKGKLPPQATDLEEAIIGAMMIDTKGVDDAIDLLTPDVFYKDSHRHIFEAITTLYEQNKGIDLLTVSTELKRVGKLELAGGDFNLIQLTQKISSSAHIEFHARIILQKYVQRQCIKTSSEIIEDSYNEDVDTFDLLDKAYKNFGDITDLLSVGKVTNFKESVRDYLKTNKRDKHGIPSSLTKLDEKLNGYQNTDLIILAARPGMGKTALILNEVLECGLRGIPVAFFSLEMSEKQIIGRFLSIISGIDIVKVNNYNLTHSEVLELKRCSDLLENLPIYLDDTGGLSPMELKIKCNKLKRDKGIKMIVVDYLQLMKIKSKRMINREQEISEISQSLKNIAKDLDVPLIALSQLSRSVEQRGSSKRPLLSDLRDSGSIEQDADIVIFIYRPEYYKIDEWDDTDHAKTHNQAELDIAKYRNGETGYCRIGCNLQYMRFMDLNHVGADLSKKYFREKPDVVEIETTNQAPPQQNNSFNSNQNSSDDDSDVPF